MSQRTYTTTAIDCDGPGYEGRGCDEVYYDSATMSPTLAEKFAARDGWAALDDDRHLCPKCVLSRVNSILAKNGGLRPCPTT